MTCGLLVTVSLVAAWHNAERSRSKISHHVNPECAAPGDRAKCRCDELPSCSCPPIVTDQCGFPALGSKFRIANVSFRPDMEEPVLPCYQMAVHRASDFVSDNLYSYGKWECHHTDYFQQLGRGHPVRKDGIFLDIGANVGTYVPGGT